ncbi:RrF2 family transcriptional regulator [Cysteiniphilum sp. JM-1]|uniref:RrF2 family transcriptional regulator n=1 Tax=Cysteiniphilum sp. JM-1 TaxID=2610891 RepID=UPI001248AE3E|nr:Rrf2 family transcriptional regulator [Cysteiniphilum sp. JM-1]
MQLTSFTDYSLRTLVYLAMHQQRLCTAKEVAEFYQISQNHMVKIVHNLAKLGVINSSKGKGGGIALAQAPKEINIGELIAKLEPNFYMAECFNQSLKNCVLLPDCKLKSVLGNALQAFFNELNQHTLADVIK